VVSKNNETTASKTKSPKPTTDYTDSTDTYPNHNAFIRVYESASGITIRAIRG